MPEKRESPEGAYGAVPQDPRDRAKAALPEPQSPAVEHAHPLLQRLEATLPGAARPLLRAATSDWQGDG